MNKNNTNIDSHNILSSSIYHAPLIVDAKTKTVYRRWGHMSYSKDNKRLINKKKTGYKIIGRFHSWITTLLFRLKDV